MIKKSKTILVLGVILLIAQSTYSQSVPAKFAPTPNERQMKYLQEPMAAFIHFGMNTFAGADGIGDCGGGRFGRRRGAGKC